MLEPTQSALLNSEPLPPGAHKLPGCSLMPQQYHQPANTQLTPFGAKASSVDITTMETVASLESS